MTSEQLSDLRLEFVDAGVSEEKVERVLELVETQSREVFSKYNVEIRDERAIPLLQEVFLSKLLEISQLDDYTLVEEVDEYIERFESGSGETDVSLLSGLAVNAASGSPPECLIEFGGAVVAENYSHSTRKN